MAGLVEEIQRDALNPAVPVSTILRKVKVAAAKLALPGVEDWVQQELDGYRGGELPDYRKLHGRPQALNPYQGWIPIIMQTDRDNDLLSLSMVRQSVSSLEDLVARTETGHVEMPFPASVIRSLNKSMDVEFGRMANHLSVVQIQGVVDFVRNLVLDWALDLERAGISGEGFSFDAGEKQRAQNSQVTYHIGSIGNFAGNLGQGNTSGAVRAEQSTNDPNVFSALADIVSTRIDDAQLRQLLTAAVAQMEASQGDRPTFATRYAEFISLAANHLSIFTPFLPALGSLLAR